ncbi:MAG: hypothetical protein HY819_20640 [Acidobacteria bacterium]|nr:hypothetical protein [Acidobacteriota bacterium]
MKYRQKGYQEENTETKEPPKESRAKQELGFGSRPSPRIETRYTEVTRCSNCSTIVDTTLSIGFNEQCKKCGNYLHSCKNCRYFDPGARFECQKPIEMRVAKKSEGNMCLQFSMKVSVEKQQAQESKKVVKESISPGKLAFDALFKK